MWVLAPITVTDAVLTASSLSEHDAHAAWSAATAYVTGNRCFSATTHKVYEARTGNTNQDPTVAANVYDAATNPSGEWIEVGATNKWRAFDGKLSDLATSSSADLSYTLEMPSSCNALALFGVEAGSVRVRVYDLDGVTVIHDETRTMVDTSAITDAYTYAFSPVLYETEAVFQDLPAFTGSTVLVEVIGSSGSTRKVGEIVIGWDTYLGDLETGAGIGITDYSRKEFDTFGNPVIIERSYADTATFPIVVETSQARRIKRVLSALRATPAVYHAGEDATPYGLTIYGFFTELPFTLETLGADGTTGVTYLNLEVEGLT